MVKRNARLHTKRQKTEIGEDREEREKIHDKISQ